MAATGGCHTPVYLFSWEEPVRRETMAQTVGSIVQHPEPRSRAPGGAAAPIRRLFAFSIR